MADGDISITLTGVDVEALVAGVTPTLGEIGAINRARTESGGFDSDTIGTFTVDTRPTNEEVEILAALSASQVADSLGNNIPDRFIERARGAAALYAASLVEGGAHLPRERLIDQWTKIADDRVKQLAIEIQQVGAGDQEGPGDDALMPVYSFPRACPLPPVF